MHDTCYQDEHKQKLDAMYIDERDASRREKDAKVLLEECENLWENELRSIHFMGDRKRAVDPIIMGTVINMAKTLVELYQGQLLHKNFGNKKSHM